ncbi:hypothetical protein HOD20_05880 [archaeon]|jgi:hypothetical protein|nr:hypothetical protein [Candidatus Woesearchaeota archaeon]MBT3463362.1 hypothetical protein [archaeon]MBT4352033.1 hypothetical protein [archaeon]MBT4648017.1 hypothetical protein [archaeon]MBT7392368.1 hypothetical protein [archaeon]
MKSKNKIKTKKKTIPSLAIALILIIVLSLASVLIYNLVLKELRLDPATNKIIIKSQESLSEDEMNDASNEIKRRIEYHFKREPTLEILDDKRILLTVHDIILERKDTLIFFLENNYFYTKIDDKQILDNWDILNVCESKYCYDVKEKNCFENDKGFSCQSLITFTVSDEASKRFSDSINSLTEISPNERLSEKYIFYLNDKEYNTYFLTSNLKDKIFKSVTLPTVVTGNTLEEAINKAKLKATQYKNIFNLKPLGTTFEIESIE